jgi:hypothetical protein
MLLLLAILAAGVVAVVDAIKCRRYNRPPTVEEIAKTLKSNLRLARPDVTHFQLKRKRSGPRSDWWRNYSAYLASPEWEMRRARILARDGYRCRRCRFQSATDVHHLTYERVGHELDEDLMSVCEACHQLLHSNKKLRRWGRL